MTLTLMQCHPSLRELGIWSAREGLVSPDGDHGYALHTLLTAAFGSAAPKPFGYLSGQRGLLGYTAADVDTLMSHAALATPEVYRILNLATLDARPFPTRWKRGQRLSFEVRVRPVVRGKTGERDAFLHGMPSEPAAGAVPPQRETVYRQWLISHLEAHGACGVMAVRLQGFQLTRVVRRAHVQADGSRNRQVFNGPDALMSGELEIRDEEAFSQLVARGVGRHRAFGFGMLLLQVAN